MKKLFFLLILLSSECFALGVSPAKLEFNLYRGESSEDTIKIINTKQEKVNYLLENNEWFSFTPEKGKLGPGEVKEVTVGVGLPEDVLNGEYNSLTKVLIVQDGEDVELKTGMGVKTKVVVSGRQEINAFVSGIACDNIEENHPLIVKAEFHNTGNVRVRPRLDLQVYRNNISFAENKAYLDYILPGEEKSVHYEWSPNLGVGVYGLKVGAYVNDRIVKKSELAFEVLPYGSLSRKGELESLDVKYDGNALEVYGVFSNKGSASKARLVVDLYKNSKYLASKESEEVVLMENEKAELRSVFSPKGPGNYKAVGRVVYSGKKTRNKIATCVIKGSIAVGLFIVVLTALGGFLITSSRSKSTSHLQL